MLPTLHLAAPRLCPCGIVHRSPAHLRRAADLRPYFDLFLAAAAKNGMLDAVDETAATVPAAFGSLHTAYSTTGTNELTGGSPAYARVALTWAAASGGSKALAATLPTWNVPAGNTAAWWGMWTLVSGGTFLGMLPVGAGTLRPASVETTTDGTNNDIFANGHGYVAGDRVVFWGSGMPSALTVGTIYYVIATGLATNSFRVSTTSGGAAVDINDTGEPYNFYVQKCVPEVFAGQGTYSLTSGSIDLGAVA